MSSFWKHLFTGCRVPCCHFCFPIPVKQTLPRILPPFLLWARQLAGSPHPHCGESHGTTALGCPHSSGTSLVEDTPGPQVRALLEGRPPSPTDGCRGVKPSLIPPAQAAPKGHPVLERARAAHAFAGTTVTLSPPRCRALLPELRPPGADLKSSPNPHHVPFSFSEAAHEGPQFVTVGIRIGPQDGT